MRGLRGLFLISFSVFSMMIEAVFAVDTLSAEDESDIFGDHTTTESRNSGKTEYIEFYPMKENIGVVNVGTQGQKAKADEVYLDLYSEAKRNALLKGDEPGYVSLFANRRLKDKRTDALSESYKNMVDACGGREKELDEKLKNFKRASLLGDVVKILENEGACYQDVGYAIIEELYQGDTEKGEAFAKKSEHIYLPAGSVEFNAKHCGENCSVKALVSAQQEKFGEFRNYLYQLIDEAKPNVVSDAKGLN